MMLNSRCVLVSIALAAGAACGSDKPGSKEGTTVKLPPLVPVGKPAAELEAQGWKPLTVPASLRDSAPDYELGFPALERELDTLLHPRGVPGFSSGFADTVQLIQRTLTRVALEERAQREAELGDSLERAMQPEPDTEALSLLPRAPRRVRLLSRHADVPVRFATWREQQTQTQSIEIAPGIQGTKTNSSNGATSTTEVSYERGPMKSTTTSTTTDPRSYDEAGEIGVKLDGSSTKRAKDGDVSREEMKRTGFERRLGYCPDAGGVVRGSYSRWQQESDVITVGTATINTSLDIESNFTITVSVDDNARAQDIVVEGSSILKLDVRARGGGNATPTLKNLRADLRWQKGVHDKGLVGNLHWRFSSANPADRRFDDGFVEALIIAMDEADDLAIDAERRWRNGACIEVTTNPDTKTLRYSDKAAFKVDVKHKREGGGSFPYPVRIMVTKGYDPSQVARLWGKITPEGPVTAAATFQYTAPAKSSAPAWWTGESANPMSISRRGIGASYFSVSLDSDRTGWQITRHNKIEIDGKGTIFTGNHKVVLRELEQPLDDGSTHAGTGTFSGMAVAGVRHCLTHKSIPQQSLTLNMKATATAEPLGGDSVSLSFSIVPAKEATNMDQAMFLMDQMVLAIYELGSFKDEKTFVDTMIPPSPCGETVRQIVTHRFKRMR